MSARIGPGKVDTLTKALQLPVLKVVTHSQLETCILEPFAFSLSLEFPAFRVGTFDSDFYPSLKRRLGLSAVNLFPQWYKS